MAMQRVTQSMIMGRSLSGMQASLARLAKTQEQLTTGRVINRPSDNPIGASSAMRLRGSLADQAQYARNGEDGAGWLGAIDGTLDSVVKQVDRAISLGIQGQAGSAGQSSRDALAGEIDQLRQGLVALGNSTYLDRPVFGGITGGSVAYDASGTFVGTAGDVTRTVAPGVKVKVNVDGTDVFGPNGSSVFDTLDALSTALTAGDTAGIKAGLDGLHTALNRITGVQADVGTRANRVDRAVEAAEDAQVSQGATLSSIESVDLPRATVDLQMQQVAYQAALGATAKVIQPSLLDFLR